MAQQVSPQQMLAVRLVSARFHRTPTLRRIPRTVRAVRLPVPRGYVPRQQPRRAGPIRAAVAPKPLRAVKSRVRGEMIRSSRAVIARCALQHRDWSRAGVQSRVFAQVTRAFGAERAGGAELRERREGFVFCAVKARPTATDGKREIARA